MNNFRDRSPISINRNVNNIRNNCISNLEVNMATSFTEINLAKEIIPLYEGGSKNLSYFIQQCEKFISAYRVTTVGQEQGTFNKLLFEICCSKLVGAARDTLVVSNCATWTQVKEELLNRFGDQRNETLLENDLITCYQLISETYDQYYERIKAKLQQILEHINLRENDANMRIHKTNMYNDRALNTFQAGLLEPYRSYISYKSPVSLEDCLVQLRKHDNHKQQVNFLNFIRHKNPAKLVKPNRNPNTFHQQNAQRNSTYTPNYNFQRTYVPPQAISRPAQVPSTSFRNQNSYHQNSNPFPRGPIDINRKPSRNMPFGNNPHRNQPQPKPTPMSICNSLRPTTNTQNRNQNYNFFQRSGPPDIISEELYNIEDSEQNDYEYEYYDDHTEPNINENYANDDIEENENFQLEASEQ